MPNWESLPIDVTSDQLDGYESTSDWISFDCICADTDSPDWINAPYDFNIQSLANRHFTCPRCGRQYILKITVEAMVHTPVDLKYPHLTKPDPKTLGLRDKE